MEEVLNETVTPEDLEKFEKKYHKELDGGTVSHKTQFEYSWCLVRSEYTPDIQKGILLLEDLATRHAEDRRDYLYYLAIGNARIKQYGVSLKYCKAFLEIEPNNQQVLSLKDFVKKKIESEGLKGMAIAGGAALLVGGLVGLGIALSKNRSKPSDKK